MATYLIDNAGSLDDLREQVDEILGRSYRPPALSAAIAHRPAAREDSVGRLWCSRIRASDYRAPEE